MDHSTDVELGSNGKESTNIQAIGLQLRLELENRKKRKPTLKSRHPTPPTGSRISRTTLSRGATKQTHTKTYIHTYTHTNALIHTYTHTHIRTINIKHSHAGETDRGTKTHVDIHKTPSTQATRRIPWGGMPLPQPPQQNMPPNLHRAAKHRNVS